MLFPGFGGFAELVSFESGRGTYVSETASGIPIVEVTRPPLDQSLQNTPHLIKVGLITGLEDLNQGFFHVKVVQSTNDQGPMLPGQIRVLSPQVISKCQQPFL
jgi:hypothetical protein